MRRVLSRVGLTVALASLTTAGCASPPAPTPTPVPSGFINLAVELSASFPPHDGSVIACGMSGYDDAVLHGSLSSADPVWLEAVARPGLKIAVRWPAGFRARFAPKLELIDPGGTVVARDGDVLTLIGTGPGQDGRIEIMAFDGKAYPPCS